MDNIDVLAWPAYKNRDSNPYQALLHEALEKSELVNVTEFSIVRALTGRFHVVHVHWPDALIGGALPARALLRLSALKIIVYVVRHRGACVIWTAHNSRSHLGHCGPTIETLFWQWWTATIDGVIFLSDASRITMVQKFPSLGPIPYAVTPHGHYKALITHGEPRDVLSTCPRLAFVGSLTAYKGLDALLDLFSENPKALLSLDIAGNLDASFARSSTGKRLAQIPSGSDKRIKLELGRMTDAEMATKVASSDLVVLPYVTVTNSGTAIFVLSCGRPILVPCSPEFSELQQQVGANWVIMYEGRLSMTDVKRALANIHVPDRIAVADGNTRGPALDNFSWENVAGKTADFYKRLISRRSKRHVVK